MGSWKHNFCLVFSWFCLSLFLQGQGNAVLDEIVQIPDQLREASSLETVDGKNFWSLNDSGNESEIYAVDLNGKLVDSVKMIGVKNVDFEAMALDETGKIFFIGDIGNNDNLRDTLSIYYFSKSDVNLNHRVNASMIRFYYPDKKPAEINFPNCAFDCEAMLHFGSYLYLFSKSRCHSKVCKCYRIPDKAGVYAAELLDSLKFPTWITSADISPDGKSMALLSETRLYLFTEFTEDHFFESTQEYFFLGSWTQKEGLAFGPENQIFICDERYSLIGGKIYKVTLPDK